MFEWYKKIPRKQKYYLAIAVAGLLVGSILQIIGFWIMISSLDFADNDSLVRFADSKFSSFISDILRGFSLVVTGCIISIAGLLNYTFYLELRIKQLETKH